MFFSSRVFNLQWKWAIWEHYKLQDLSNLNILMRCVCALYLCSYIKNYSDKLSFSSTIPSKLISFYGCAASSIIFHFEDVKLLCRNFPGVNSLFNYLTLVQWIPCPVVCDTLTLWKEDKTSRYEGWLWMYWIISHGLLTRGGSTAFGFAQGLATSHPKLPALY